MADKLKCPKCGTENYTTDPVCLNCGASLQEPPARPAAADPAASPTPAAPRPGPGGPAQPAAPPAPQSALGPWLTALGLCLALTAVEMVLLNAATQHTYPKILWGISYEGTAAARIIVWTLIFGALRMLLIGGLMYLTPWGPSVGLVVGLVLGFAGLGTIFGGLVIGFLIGIVLEHHKLNPQP